MALEKQKVVDVIEVVKTGAVQVRTATRVIENGNVISETFHRHVVVPGEDYSGEDARVQAICKTTHTKDVVSAYKTAQSAAQSMQFAAQ